MVVKWIQKIHIKKGALHRDLGIPQSDKIPLKLLDAIIKAKAGDVIKNPTTKGKKKIEVTSRLERRAIFARNMKKIK